MIQGLHPILESGMIFENSEREETPKFMDQVTLSVVVAVYNESPYNLHNLIERLEKVLVPANISYEVVFVNDGSKEETSTCLIELCQRHNYVKLVNFSRNFGQQAAISAGINLLLDKR